MMSVLNKHLLYFRGRVALSELLNSANIGENDFVAIQAYTCSAVPEGVFASNAKPVYIDVVKEGVTMSPDDLELKLKNIKNVKAIVIQHTFGVVADVERIVEISKKYNLIVIEDCCHSYNSEYKGEKVGSFSDASFYSFEWGKPVSLGLGGSAQVKNKQMLERLKKQYRSLVNPPLFTEFQLFIQRIAFFTLYNPRTYWTVKFLYHFFSKYGIIKGNHTSCKIDQKSKEFDYKISRILRSKLVKKMNKLHLFEDRSKKIVSLYEKKLLKLNGVEKIKILPESKSIYVRYPLWVSNKEKTSNLAYENKVEIASWYSSPVHPYVDDQLSSVGYKMGSCPNAEDSSRHIVSLPIPKKISNKYLQKMIKVLSNL
jgi:perosamine synthetase